MFLVIDTKDVIAFFDRLAPNWDADMVRNEEVISSILDNVGVDKGKDVLDVACGTGVLIPDYCKREVKSVTAIDISPKMIEIAKGKFEAANTGDSCASRIDIICGDVETYEFGKLFDCIVIYNAFPHFPDPKRLIDSLSRKLKPGGRLTVAHGMSRERINAHHSGSAMHVSNGLMSSEELAEIFEEVLDVTTVISDDRMYQVVGKLISD